MYIYGRGKIGYLIGDMKELAADDANYPTWEVENLMVMTWLVNSMEDINLNYVLSQDEGASGQRQSNVL